MAFAINIGNPRHGWIDVEFHVDEKDFTFRASAVANDPVRELAELALFIVHGAPWKSYVTFWLEPDGFELRAIRDPELKLMVSYADSAFARLFDPVVVMLERAVDQTATAAEILRCLRVAQPTFAKATALDASAWGAGFPDDLVLQLEQALATSTS